MSLKKREDFNKLDKRVQRRRLSRYLSFVRAYKNYMRRKMVFGKIVFEFENVYYEDVLLYSKFTPILINQPHTRAVQQKFKEKLKLVSGFGEGFRVSWMYFGRFLGLFSAILPYFRL